jgi:predicted DCC family thiol-disulfide oxidoreductase YuxK
MNASTTTDEGRAAVLYDDDCGFCKWSLNKILAWDRRGRLRPVAIQSEEGRRLLASLPAEQHLETAHLVTPGGELLSAGAAAPPLLRLLPGGRPLAFLLDSFPRTTDRAYRFVVDHRSGFARIAGVDSSCEVRRR